MRNFLTSILVLCGGMVATSTQAQTPPISPATLAAFPEAPVARSNWTVTKAGNEVFAFYGLGTGKTSNDIASDVYALNLRSHRWRRVGDVPVTQGRLGSAAVTIAGQVYVIGGYTVSSKGDEVSTAEVFRLDPATGQMSLATHMPTPVDDSVALPWRDRWIVLVSGWHDEGNVTAVQIYDTQTQRWTIGTSWPGVPVFGHAGGIVEDAMVVCDGVTAVKGADGKHHYDITDACWRGQLDPRTVGRIQWQRIAPHPGLPLYRAGATGAVDPLRNARIVFAGGTHRPYNYNGIGYDRVPAEPSSAVFGFDLKRDAWISYAPMPRAGMDFRGMVPLDDSFSLFGGMDANQAVVGNVITFDLLPAGKPH